MKLERSAHADDGGIQQRPGTASAIHDGLEVDCACRAAGGTALDTPEVLAPVIDGTSALAVSAHGAPPGWLYLRSPA